MRDLCDALVVFLWHNEIILNKNELLPFSVSAAQANVRDHIRSPSWDLPSREAPGEPLQPI